MRILLYLTFYIAIPTMNLGQEADPDQILDMVRARYDQIRDFSAEVEIDVNVDFIKIPNKYATVLFKYPDKFKFRSSDFIMVPRGGYGFSVMELLEKPYSAVYSGKVEYKGKELEEVKIIPLEKKTDIVLATLWIEVTKGLVYYLEADTRKSGYFITEFEYGENEPLPERNIIRFEVDNLKLPLRFIGKVNIDEASRKDEENTMGEVIIKYSNYRVNSGIDEDEFKEPEEETLKEIN